MTPFDPAVTCAAGLPAAQRSFRIGFVLLDGFSLPGYRQTLDVLVQANLNVANAFDAVTLVVGANVSSECGLRAAGWRLHQAELANFDMFVVGGSARAGLSYRDFDQLITRLACHDAAVLGFWQGSCQVGRGDLLAGFRCARLMDDGAAGLDSIERNLEHPEPARCSMLLSRTQGPAVALLLGLIRNRYGQQLASRIKDALGDTQDAGLELVGARRQSSSDSVRDLLRVMESNLSVPLAMEQLAARAGRTRRQVERIFKDQLGTSPRRHYLHLRLARARTLLRFSSLPLNAVGQACGFVSLVYFKKSYAQHYGYSPSMEGQVRQALPLDAYARLDPAERST
ncbi:helix-turn-helix domain-containing protein [Pseudomonas putida]|uniref:helix-turn-helix domain-containing protein n=1 Tax=Pseudomonas putida TaxID=303 RepID=UPI003F2A0EA8